MTYTEWWTWRGKSRGRGTLDLSGKGCKEVRSKAGWPERGVDEEVGSEGAKR